MTPCVSPPTDWLPVASGLGNLTRSIQPLQPPSFIISLLRSVTVFALVKAIPHVILHLGLPSIFFFHGGVCALAAIFAWKFVPETRGKTLSQLCSIYEAKKTPSLWIWRKKHSNLQYIFFVFVRSFSLNLMWRNNCLTSGFHGNICDNNAAWDVSVSVSV